MPLKLAITSYQRLSPGQETTKFLDGGSISIGRSAQNDWILQDPERILSGKHCTIHHQDGGYFLTDTSTNGVFLNNSEQRIGRNQIVRLKDGDRFILGEYEIAATLIPAGAEPEESEPEGPVTDIMPPQILVPDIAIAEAPRPSSTADIVKPSFADILAEDHLGLHRPPGPPAGGIVTEPPADLSAPDRAFFEPPALIPEPPPPLEPLPPSPKPARRTEPVSPVLAQLKPKPPAQPLPIRSEPPPAELALESKSPAEESIIPEDWWLAPPATPQPTAMPPLELPVPPPFAEPGPPVPARPAFKEPVKPKPPLSATPLEPPATPPAPSERPAPPTATPATLELSGPSAETLLRTFLDGAGLPRGQMAEDQLPEIVANLGAIFRETVQGLMKILQARSDVKGEFRLDRTTLGPMENNPLKTPPGQPSLSPEEVMTLLLIRQKDAYMSPVQAVRESFQDIMAHQHAVWDGVRAAMNRLLERFDPHNLETRLQQTVLDSILPVNRKAKYWDLFTTEYQAIAHEAEEDFNELFGNEFARAYEERLRGH